MKKLTEENILNYLKQEYGGIESCKISKQIKIIKAIYCS